MRLPSLGALSLARVFGRRASARDAHTSAVWVDERSAYTDLGCKWDLPQPRERFKMSRYVALRDDETSRWHVIWSAYTRFGNKAAAAPLTQLTFYAWIFHLAYKVLHARVMELPGAAQLEGFARALRLEEGGSSAFSHPFLVGVEAPSDVVALFDEVVARRGALLESTLRQGRALLAAAFDADGDAARRADGERQLEYLTLLYLLAFDLQVVALVWRAMGAAKTEGTREEQTVAYAALKRLVALLQRTVALPPPAWEAATAPSSYARWGLRGLVTLLAQNAPEWLYGRDGNSNLVVFMFPGFDVPNNEADDPPFLAPGRASERLRAAADAAAAASR